jgi:hypothetical protein
MVTDHRVVLFKTSKKLLGKQLQNEFMELLG